MEGAGTAIVRVPSAPTDLVNLHDTGGLDEALERRIQRNMEERATMPAEEGAARQAWVAARVQQAIAIKSGTLDSAAALPLESVLPVPAMLLGLGGVSAAGERVHVDVDVEGSFSQLVVLDPEVEQSALSVAEEQGRRTDTHAAAARHVAAVVGRKLTDAALSGIGTVVKAMEEHQYNAEVQEAGCQALCTLAAKVPPGMKDHEVGSEGIRACVRSLRSLPFAEAVTQAACLALAALSPLVEPCAVSAEGAEAMGGVLHGYTANAAVETLACKALLQLLADAAETEDAGTSMESSVRGRAVAAKALEGVLAALEAQPNFALLQVGAGLCLISKTRLWADSGPNPPPPLRLPPQESGLDLVAELLPPRRKAEPLHKAAVDPDAELTKRRAEKCDVVLGGHLLAVAAAGDKGRDRAAAGGSAAIEAVLRALRLHAANGFVAQNAFRVLARIDDSLLRAAASRGAIEVVTAGMRVHRTNPAAQAAGCQALRPPKPPKNLNNNPAP